MFAIPLEARAEKAYKNKTKTRKKRPKTIKRIWPSRAKKN